MLGFSPLATLPLAVLTGVPVAAPAVNYRSTMLRRLQPWKRFSNTTPQR